MSGAKENVMNRLSCVVCIGLVALGGCGGDDDEIVAPRAAELAAAPTELLAAAPTEPAAAPTELAAAPAALDEVDLPGCEALATHSARRWEVLRHPDDPALAVVTGDGRPVCVDTRDAALLLVQQQGIGLPLGLQSISPSPLGGPHGDRGNTGGEGSEGGGGGGGGGDGSQGRQHLAMMPSKRSLISDDPLPPPGSSRHVVPSESK